MKGRSLCSENVEFSHEGLCRLSEHVHWLRMIRSLCLRNSNLVQTLLATRCLESGFLHPDYFAGCIRNEATFGLAKHRDGVPKWIANDGAAANRNIEGGGNGLASGFVEALKRPINIGHQKIHFRTKGSVQDKLRETGQVNSTYGSCRRPRYSPLLWRRFSPMQA